MTSDTGSAPCVFLEGHKKANILTLSCCKGGQIRNYKNGNTIYVNTGLRWEIGRDYKESINSSKEDVYVIGVYRNYIMYIAKVTKVLEMIDYFSSSEYQNRLDYIYDVVKFDGEEKFGKLKRNKNNKYFHPEENEEQHIRDELGKYVLVSDTFCYFGCEFENVPVPKDLIKEFPKKQEKIHCNSDNAKFPKIKALIVKYINKSDKSKNHISAAPVNKLKDYCKEGCAK